MTTNVSAAPFSVATDIIASNHFYAQVCAILQGLVSIPQVAKPVGEFFVKYYTPSII